MGNLRSVAQALRAVAPEADVLISSEPADIDAADRVVLPGQGAMRDCMHSLRESGAEEALLRARETRPVMGVCVGEQMLFDAQRGRRCTPGLGLLPGKVVRFQLDGKLQADGSRFKVPQMGWNRVRQARAHPLWDGVADDAYFYFVHSYYAQPARSAGHHRRDRLRRRRTAAPSRATTSSPPSSTPRKARPPACACTRISSTGIPERSVPSPDNLTDNDHAADSRHRPERRSLRSPETGRYGPCHRVFRRSRRDGAALAEEGRAPPAPGRPERRLRRQAEERGGDQVHPAGGAGLRRRQRHRRDPGPAGRRHPRPRHHRALPGRRHHLHHRRHRRGEEPGLPARRLRRLPGPRSSSAWTPRTARSPPTAGARCPATK